MFSLRFSTQITLQSHSYSRMFIKIEIIIKKMLLIKKKNLRYYKYVIMITKKNIKQVPKNKNNFRKHFCVSLCITVHITFTFSVLLL